MKKTLATLLLLLACAASGLAADWRHAVVQYKNGEKLECQAEYIPFATPIKSFKIRRDAGSKPETVMKDSVDIVVMEKTDSTLYVACNYPYVNCKKYLKGDMKLVTKHFLPLSEPGFLQQLGYTVYGGMRPVYTIYLKRQDVDFAIELVIKGKTGKDETDAIRKYIADYEELAASLEGKKLNHEEIANLVKEYNQWKGNGGK